MRAKNSLRNLLYGYSLQIASILLNFVHRTIFIKYLSIEYLGINGLFSNILLVLSFAEMGLGGAITFSLYKPLADDDHEAIGALVSFYKKCYSIIAVVSLVLGAAASFFLEYIIRDYHSYSQPLRLIYFLYLLNMVTTYFFAHKRSLIIAAQKAYLNSVNTFVFLVLQYGVQIVILVTTRNFISYLIAQMMCTILSNVFLSKRVNKEFPYLADIRFQKLPSAKIREIARNTYALLLHKIGVILVNYSGNIILSSFLGLAAVGVYSNYTMILASLNGIANQFSNSVSASVGNVNAVEDSAERKYQIYKTLDLISFWIYGTCSVCVFVLINPFIEMWIGREYVLHTAVAALIVLDFYISGMRANIHIFKNSAGLYWNDRYRPIFEIAVNLAISLYCVRVLGTAGIVLGMIACKWGIACWVEAKVLFNNVFECSVRRYLARYGLQVITLSAIAALSYLVCSFITLPSTLLSLIVKAFVCIGLFSALLLVYSSSTDEFKAIKQTALALLPVRFRFRK